MTIDRSLEDRKLDLVFKLLINPADQDYLAARWSFDSGLFSPFYNAAGQALEKYLKAALLIQDMSTLGYGRDLVRLYEAVADRDGGGILPVALDLPETTGMGRDEWQGKPPLLFATFLGQYGSPDDPEAFYGTFVNGPVLNILDLLCHALRKMIRHTNLSSRDLFEVRSSGEHRVDRVPHPLDWMVAPDALLERLYLKRYDVGQSEKLRCVFLKTNIAFTAERQVDERTFGGLGFAGSPLHNALVRHRQLDPSPENIEIVDRLRSWARENVPMSKDVRKELGYAD